MSKKPFKRAAGLARNERIFVRNEIISCMGADPKPDELKKPFKALLKAPTSWVATMSDEALIEAVMDEVHNAVRPLGYAVYRETSELAGYGYALVKRQIVHKDGFEMSMGITHLRRLDLLRVVAMARRQFRAFCR
ncbi:TPA: hypothetical protein ACJJYF_001395 [Enterobacter cloacae]|uniref:Uncharacterized protein n=1 Tax=Enterobacter kobei TaxID=208224 RepID=A0A2J0PJB3_9ENTR|nr:MULTISPECIES: hypothetical protein [Enterobacter cloacae complex]MCE1547221.1 hypothetical protein [Enterobacter hormaechei]KPU03844.1 hypothetical protein AN697_16155 [Enterobacter cloacae subsp. cloacae]PJD65362.1 hypothetical protein B9Q29_20525 [Enterobacter kobei]PJD74634.1 hypothetical protein B9Q37_12125 [Enterobacter kobei]HBM2451790.1 hypothetical protein [Enterobacter hormaechei]